MELGHTEPGCPPIAPLPVLPLPRPPQPAAYGPHWVSSVTWGHIYAHAPRLSPASRGVSPCVWTGEARDSEWTYCELLDRLWGTLAEHSAIRWTRAPGSGALSPSSLRLCPEFQCVNPYPHPPAVSAIYLLPALIYLLICISLCMYAVSIYIHTHTSEEKVGVDVLSHDKGFPCSTQIE